MADVETGKLRAIVVGSALGPSWSPHGTRIGYWGLKAGGGQRDLFTVRADGSEAAGIGTPLTDDAPLDCAPVWSADGRFLYLSSKRGGSM